MLSKECHQCMESLEDNNYYRFEAQHMVKKFSLDGSKGYIPQDEHLLFSSSGIVEICPTCWHRILDHVTMPLHPVWTTYEDLKKRLTVDVSRVSVHDIVRE